MKCQPYHYKNGNTDNQYKEIELSAPVGHNSLEL